MLKKSDLVKSVRGYQGGYTLSREPSKITVGEILRVLEGELNIVDENSSIEEKSNKIEDSINRIVWNQINESINNVVDSITLDFLVLEYKRAHYSNSFDYSI
jgi:Rrf2 family protein